jgi:hypothetical protein
MQFLAEMLEHMNYMCFNQTCMPSVNTNRIVGLVTEKVKTFPLAMIG